MSEEQDVALSEETAKGSGRHFRLALLGMLAIFALIMASRSIRSTVSEVEQSGPRIDQWSEEVLKTAGVTSCSSRDGELGRAAARVRELSIGWEERARLDPGEYLTMLQRVEHLIQCDASRELTGAKQKEEWRQLRISLQERVRSLLRVHHALLRRAQNREDLSGTLREVHSLRLLLRAHPGPLSGALRRWEHSLLSEG